MNKCMVLNYVRMALLLPLARSMIALVLLNVWVCVSLLIIPKYASQDSEGPGD